MQLLFYPHLRDCYSIKSCPFPLPVANLPLFVEYYNKNRPLYNKKPRFSAKNVHDLRLIMRKSKNAF